MFHFSLLTGISIFVVYFSLAAFAVTVDQNADTIAKKNSNESMSDQKCYFIEEINQSLNLTNEISKTECTQEGPCKMLLWSIWSQCTVSCGGGIQNRERDLLEGPEADCFNLSFSEFQACNNVCCPIECQVGQWDAWGACSASCGPKGIRLRKKQIIREAVCGGDPCPPSQEPQACTPAAACCPTDCVMGQWGAFGPCSASCGPGQRSRTRAPVAEATCGGALCTSQPTVDTQPCKLKNCPCLQGWFHAPPYCYLDTKTRNDYYKAKSACASIGARLPIFRTVAEWDTCLAWAGPNQQSSFWVGLTDFAIKHTFAWDDGTESKFPGRQYPWTTTDPDQIASFPTCLCPALVDCVRAEISRNFGWMDDFCSPPGGWNTVCQMDEIK